MFGHPKLYFGEFERPSKHMLSAARIRTRSSATLTAANNRAKSIAYTQQPDI
jgi:hypothetical protein